MLKNFHVNDSETGSALALLLSAAGYEVETDIHDGTLFISADGVEPELCLPDDQDGVNGLACQLRERMDDLGAEVEFAELSSQFHNVA